jgi:4-hydroxy-tetrahydrodipicolinate synthase
MKKLYGTGVALVTPFAESLEIDFKALKKLLQHTAKGVDYYVVMGTTGEAATCSEEEKHAVLQFVRDNNTSNLPIVYGIGGNNTQHIIDSIRSTDFSGVSALLSVSPYYSKPPQEGIIRHFSTIADHSPVPVILYNIPSRTASNLTAETTLRLAAHENIIGTKEASGNLEQCMKISKNMPKDFLLLSGDDMQSVAMYAIGAKGVISVLANAYPRVFSKIKEYAFAGNYPKASQQLFRLLEINSSMYAEGNPVGIKYLLEVLGVCKSFVRLPLLEASGELQAVITRLAVDIKNKG